MTPQLFDTLAHGQQKFYFSEFLVDRTMEQAYIASRPASSEGRFAIVTERWGRDAMDASCHRRMTHEADGKGVWS